MSGVCRSFVNWENFTAVSVCSSILADVFCSELAILSSEYGFESFFSDSQECFEEESKKYLPKTELSPCLFFC